MIMFVAGIDTGIGKTVATGLMARWYVTRGFSVVTQKLVQTGCSGFSEDILVHRKIMGIDLLPEDRLGLTCPYVFRFPGSPHLAAALEGREIVTDKLDSTARELAQKYEIVLVEGAGGLCVPLNEQTTAVDFVQKKAWPVVLVTAPRLGSINHTLLSLEALYTRRIPLAGVIYNLHHTASREIVADSRRVIERSVRRVGYDAPVMDIPSSGSDGTAAAEFLGLPASAARST